MKKFLNYTSKTTFIEVKTLKDTEVKTFLKTISFNIIAGKTSCTDEWRSITSTEISKS